MAKRTLTITSPLDGTVTTRTTEAAYTHCCVCVKDGETPRFSVCSWHTSAKLAQAAANSYHTCPGRKSFEKYTYAVVPVDPQ